MVNGPLGWQLELVEGRVAHLVDIAVAVVVFTVTANFLPARDFGRIAVVAIGAPTLFSCAVHAVAITVARSGGPALLLGRISLSLISLLSRFDEGGLEFRCQSEVVLHRLR